MPKIKFTPEQQLTCLARNTHRVIAPVLAAFGPDPGTSDLDDEQPIHITITLGDYRALSLLRYELEKCNMSANSALTYTPSATIDTLAGTFTTPLAVSGDYSLVSELRIHPEEGWRLTFLVSHTSGPLFSDPSYARCARVYDRHRQLKEKP